MLGNSRNPSHPIIIQRGTRGPRTAPGPSRCGIIFKIWTVGPVVGFLTFSGAGMVNRDRLWRALGGLRLSAVFGEHWLGRELGLILGSWCSVYAALLTVDIRRYGGKESEELGRMEWGTCGRCRWLPDIASLYWINYLLQMKCFMLLVYYLRSCHRYSDFVGSMYFIVIDQFHCGRWRSWGFQTRST